jgi:phosphatidylglycerol lysyltransferase
MPITSASDSTVGGLIRARRLVLQYGRNATCWQILHPEWSRWFAPAGDGVVGFVTSRRVRVVAGEPVCSTENLAPICKAFEQDAARTGERVCYLAAERPLVDRLERHGRHVTVPIGAQPVWSPAGLETGFQRSASLRYQCRRARNKGLVVSEWPSAAGDLSGLECCLKSWLKGKAMPALAFMTDPHLLTRLDSRRLWVAERGGITVGYTVLSPVPARQGWLVEQIVRCDGAPNGTAENLVAAAARAVAATGSRFITLGTSPLSRRGGRLSRQHPLWLRVVTGWMRAHGTRFYNFRGLEHFKAKFQPQAWEPVFAVAAEPRLRPATLYAVLEAFTRRSLLLAGLQAVGAGLSKEIRNLVLR